MDGSIVWTMSVMDNVTAHLDTMTQAENRLADTTAQTNAQMGAQGGQVSAVTASTLGYTASAQEAALAGDTAADSAQRMAATQMEAKAATDRTTQAVTSQNVSWLKNLAAVSALSIGMRRLTSSMTELGLISEEDERKLQKVNAAVGLVVGTYQLFKGVTAIVNALRGSVIALAAVETYRSVINSKGASLAIVGLGVGAAAAGAGYLYGQSQRAAPAPVTTVSQSIVFEQGASSEQRAMGRELLSIMGG